MSHAPEWYDQAYLSYPSYESTPMKHMYDKVARMIPRLGRIIDLGCGNGYLASALKDRYFAGQYLGWDFSPVAVEMAISALSDPQMTLFPVDPQYKFEVADLLTQHENQLSHQTIYTCFEVLEHIEEDINIVSMVPARARFIFSVPNYWSSSHVRTYDTVGTAIERYGHILSFKSWWIMPTKQEGAAIHLYDASRRADIW